LGAGCKEAVLCPEVADCVIFFNCHTQVVFNYTHPSCKACSSLGAGYKERVSRPEVTEAARFAKYAIAAYGAAGFQYLHQTS